MNIGNIMTENLRMCAPDTGLSEVARMMVEADCGQIPVIDADRKPIGVVTDRDITCRLVAHGRNPLELTASDCMTAPCITTTSNTDITDCCRLLEEHKLRRIIVVDANGCVCGIIAQADIAKHLPAELTARVVKEVSQERR